MRWIGHAIVRLVQVLFGLAVAFLCCALFIGFGFATEFVDLPEFRGDGPSAGATAVILGLLWSPFVAAAAFFPALCVIAIAEMLRWRGFIANCLMGAAAALTTYYLSFGHPEPRLPSQGTLVVLLATGFIGGAAYWLVAGHRAGDWQTIQSDRNLP